MLRGIILETDKRMHNDKYSDNRENYKSIYKYLCDPGPDLIILDEGHRIKDDTKQLSMALQKIKTHKRMILTGYPIQNHLFEYYTMVNYCMPGLLGSKEEFKNVFILLLLLLLDI